MKYHSSNVNVQHFGCAALGTLAVHDNNKKMIAVSGGIPMIVSAMNCHLDSADVQHYGCAALWCLAENDINKVALANASGKGAIDSKSLI